ncbi:MAG: T9SS type A sorting domain-containing protein [Ignavibacterium sp.]|nr:T9SS type A sorting domain-containing protein [Ignavibacterium sp.]MCX7612382.1 T9SS type A sorting domain-containing protein [Ignavibacterium sp.]MDW8376261.1 choice-of-anchor J domain-containing protein [Ignavibacteriales bacterium]
MKKFLLLFLFSCALLVAQDENLVRPGTAESFKNEATNTTFTSEAIIFQDNFNGDNSVAGLQARGWIVVDQDGGGSQPAWFTPSATPPFPAFEGPTQGYVASNYQGANGFYISHWLISPVVGVSAGDTLSFYHRAPDNNQWDDSMFVRVSPTGGSNVANFTISSPRFLVSETGWAQYNYIFTVSGFVRFALHYQIFDGGLNGNYSNYIGIDMLQVKGAGFIPVELTSFTAAANGNNVVLNWATATEKNNEGFEIQRNNGNGFVTIGFVKGNGTTTQPQNYSFVDKNVRPGTYSYRLKQIDFGGTSDYSKVVSVEVLNPNEFSLEQNYPNPFNPSTKINFSLAVDSKVSLKVFNVLGQEVTTLLNGNLAAGYHEINFKADGLNSGIYFYKLEATGIDGKSFSSVKKMILNK